MSGCNGIQNVTLLNGELFVSGLEVYKVGEGNYNRNDSLEGVPSELIGGIEVFKSPNASLLEGGLGGIVNLKTGDAEADAACEKIHAALIALGLDPLYDDTTERAGAKFATMDLIGLPWRITVGPRGLKNGVVELTSRRTGESEEMPPEEAVERVSQIYSAKA